MTDENTRCERESGVFLFQKVRLTKKRKQEESNWIHSSAPEQKKRTESKQSIRSFEKTQRIYTPEFSTANS